jgi:hypothetical protein
MAPTLAPEQSVELEPIRTLFSARGTLHPWGRIQRRLWWLDDQNYGSIRYPACGRTHTPCGGQRIVLTRRQVVLCWH